MNSFTGFFKNRKIRNGLITCNQASIDILVDTYADGLFRYALSIVRNEEDACEVVQEFFLKMVRNTEVLKEVKNLKTYIYKALKNTAIDFLRGRKTELAFDEMFVDADTDIEDKGPTSDVRMDISNSFRQLSSDYQEVIFLKFYQDLSFREIGEVLNISPNTAASRYRYALDNLRIILKGEGQSENDRYGKTSQRPEVKIARR
jgi:RNA polymerase sigma-70 factor, ECF subfamily